MNKRDLTIWVLFLALVAIILAGVLWCVNNRFEEIDKAGDVEVVIPEKNPQDIDTSNWKTYRNEEYGYELRYPEDWKVEYDIDTWISSMDGVGGVSIKLEKDLVVEDYIVHYNNSDISNGMSLSKILTVENVDINGKEAVVLMGSTSIGINNLITVIANGDDLYTLTYKDVQQYHAENSAIVESFILSR